MSNFTVSNTQHLLRRQRKIYLRLLMKIFSPCILLFLLSNEKENKKIKKGIHFDQDTNAHVRDSIPTG